MVFIYDLHDERDRIGKGARAVEDEPAAVFIEGVGVRGAVEIAVFPVEDHNRAGLRLAEAVVTDALPLPFDPEGRRIDIFFSGILGILSGFCFFFKASSMYLFLSSIPEDFFTPFS